MGQVIQATAKWLSMQQHERLFPGNILHVRAPDKPSLHVHHHVQALPVLRREGYVLYVKAMNEATERISASFQREHKQQASSALGLYVIVEWKFVLLRCVPSFVNFTHKRTRQRVHKILQGVCLHKIFIQCRNYFEPIVVVCDPPEFRIH